jgi:hypothetical protein
MSENRTVSLDSELLGQLSLKTVEAVLTGLLDQKMNLVDQVKNGTLSENADMSDLVYASTIVTKTVNVWVETMFPELAETYFIYTGLEFSNGDISNVLTNTVPLLKEELDKHENVYVFAADRERGGYNSKIEEYFSKATHLMAIQKLQEELARDNININPEEDINMSEVENVVEVVEGDVSAPVVETPCECEGCPCEETTEAVVTPEEVDEGSPEELPAEEAAPEVTEAPAAQ